MADFKINGLMNVNIQPVRKAVNQFNKLLNPNEGFGRNVDKQLQQKIRHINQLIANVNNKENRGINSREQLKSLLNEQFRVAKAYDQIKSKIQSIKNLNNEQLYNLLPSQTKTSIKDANSALSKYDSQLKKIVKEEQKYKTQIAQTNTELTAQQARLKQLELARSTAKFKSRREQQKRINQIKETSQLNLQQIYTNYGTGDFKTDRQNARKTYSNAVNEAYKVKGKIKDKQSFNKEYEQLTTILNIQRELDKVTEHRKQIQQQIANLTKADGHPFKDQKTKESSPRYKMLQQQLQNIDKEQSSWKELATQAKSRYQVDFQPTKSLNTKNITERVTQLQNLKKIIEADIAKIVQLSDHDIELKSVEAKRKINEQQQTTAKELAEAENYNGPYSDQINRSIDSIIEKRQKETQKLEELTAAQKEYNAETKKSTLFNDLKNQIKDITGLDTIQSVKSFEQLQKVINNLKPEKIQELRNYINGLGDELDRSDPQVKKIIDSLNSAKQAQRKYDEQTKDVQSIKRRVAAFFELSNSINLLRRTIRSAFNTVKQLDKVMTQTAVVTDFSVADMWGQLGQYTDQANKLGVAIKDAYEAATLWYQQGLKTEQVMAVSNETLKMARIGGLDAADATNKMTAALRGFNMEIDELNAKRIDDVYSKLAAITAADTNEIATAMTKTASIASNAGMQFETTAAFLSQIIQTTRESAETAGTAMKTIIARFSQLKKDPSQIEQIDGEIVDANKIQGALRSVGVALRDQTGQFRDLDKVFIELSQKWNTLDTNTQRYVATLAAGSRQQSRFIAMVSNYTRTQELISAAENSSGAANKQYEKTLESLESKLAKLKNSWDEFALGIMNSDLVKWGVDSANNIITFLNNITDSSNNTWKSIKKLGIAIVALKLGRGIVNNGFEAMSNPESGVGKFDILGGLAAGIKGTFSIIPKELQFLGQLKNKSQQVNGSVTKGWSLLAKYTLGLNEMSKEQRMAGLSSLMFGENVKVLSAEQTKLLTTTTALNLKLVAIIATVGLVVVSLVALYKYCEKIRLENSLAYALQQAQIASDNLSESISNLSTQIEDLSESGNKLKNLQDQFKVLTKGTDQWKQKALEIQQYIDDFNKQGQLKLKFNIETGQITGINGDNGIEILNQKKSQLQLNRLSGEIAQKIIDNQIINSESQSAQESFLDLSGNNKGMLAGMLGIQLNNMKSNGNFQQFVNDWIGRGITQSTARDFINGRFENAAMVANAVGSNPETFEAFNKLITSLSETAQLNRDWNIGTNISAIDNYLRATNFDNPYAEAAAQFLNGEDIQKMAQGAAKKYKNSDNLENLYQQYYKDINGIAEQLTQEQLQEIKNTSKSAKISALAGYDVSKSLQETYEQILNNTKFWSTQDPAMVRLLSTQGRDITYDDYKQLKNGGLGFVNRTYDQLFRDNAQKNWNIVKERFKELEQNYGDLINGLTYMSAKEYGGKLSALGAGIGSNGNIADTLLRETFGGDFSTVVQFLNAKNWYDKSTWVDLYDNIQTLGLQSKYTSRGISQLSQRMIQLTGATRTLNFEKLAQGAKSIAKIRTDIASGQQSQTISADDYQLLTQLDDNLKNAFALTANGQYKYLGNSMYDLRLAIDKATDTLAADEEQRKSGMSILNSLVKSDGWSEQGLSQKLIVLKQGGLLDLLGLGYIGNNSANDFLENIPATLVDQIQEALDKAVASSYGINDNANLNNYLNVVRPSDTLANLYKNMENSGYSSESVLAYKGKLSELLPTNLLQGLFKQIDNGNISEQLRVLLTELSETERTSTLFGKLGENAKQFLDAFNNTQSSFKQLTLLGDILQQIGVTMDDSINAESVVSMMEGITQGSYEAYLSVIRLVAQNAGNDIGEIVNNQILNQLKIDTLNQLASFGLIKQLDQNRFELLEEELYKSSLSGLGIGSDTTDIDNWQNPYDWLYDMNQKINAQIKQREHLQRKYQRVLTDEKRTARELQQISINELKNLQQQAEAQKNKALTSNDELNTIMSANTNFMRYVNYDANSGRITIDWTGAETAFGNNATNGNAFEAFVSRIEELRDQVVDSKQNLQDIYDEVAQIGQRGKEQYIDLQNRVMAGLMSYYQDQIDKMSQINTSINESDTKLIDAISSNISKVRADRQKDRKLTDLNNKKQRLAYLQMDTSGGNDLEILALQKEIADDEESYTDSLIDEAIDELRDTNEKAQEQRQRQIEILQSSLDYDKQTGKYWQQVTMLMNNGINQNGIVLGSGMTDFLHRDGGYQTLSELQKTAFDEELIQSGKLAAIFTSGQIGDYANQLKENIDNMYNAINIDNDGLKFTNKDIRDKFDAFLTDSATWPKAFKTSFYGADSGYGSTNTAIGQKFNELFKFLTEHLDKSEEPISVPSKFNNPSIYTDELIKRAYRQITDHDKENGYVTVKTSGGIDRIFEIEALTEEYYKRFNQYATGGLNTTTGPAWLDGTKSHPQYVLNARDTQVYLTLRDILSDFLSNSNASNVASGDNYYDIDIGVDSITSDYDIEKIATKIKSMIVSDANYRNVNSINRLR